MTTTEHSPKAPHSTGLFAVLHGLLRVRGSGAGGRALNHRRPLLLLPLILVSFSLACTATPALAAGANSAHGYNEHPLGSGPGSEADQLELVAPFRGNPWGFFGAAPVTIAGSGVAVNDQTHEVYVADTGNHRVDEFEADGKFIRAFGKDVDGLEDTCTLICEAGGSGSAPGELAAPRFVAVDNSSGPSHGDVYVGDGVGKEAQNGRQFVEINGATEGTFTLTVEGKTTAAIPYINDGYTGNGNEPGPDAVNAQKMLEEKLGSGTVHVGELGGGPTITRGLSVEFIGALKETVVPQLGCDPSALVPAGAGCQVTVGQEGSHFAAEIISKFNSEGKLEAGWGDSAPAPNGQLTGRNASEGPFAGRLQGIAVDHANGDLWVLTTGGPGFVNGQELISHSTYLYKFGEAGGFIEDENVKENFPVVSLSASGIAIDGEGKLITAPAGDTGLALDSATGGLYFDSGSLLEQVNPHEVFGSEQLQAGGGAGLAVDSSEHELPFSGSVYEANTVSDQVDVFPVLLETETGAASEVSATSMTLSGKVNPDGSEVAECDFEYGTSEEYEHAVPCEQKPDEIGSGTVLTEVHAQIKGLLGGTTYHFRLVATKGTTTVPGDDAQAPTLTTPVVANAQAPLLGVTASSAQLRATVDPEGLQVDRCVFEYGTSASYGKKALCEQSLEAIGAGSEPVAVSAQISGLEANTTYHWRLVATNENGSSLGSPGSADHTFVYPTTGSELPDHRAYEMVSPPEKNGGSLGNTFFFYPKYAVAESGSRVIMAGVQCFAEAQSCTALRVSLGEPFEFTRTDEAGQCEPQAPPCWKTTALAPPATQFASTSSAWLYSAGEGMALFSMPTSLGEADDWYARDREPEPGGSFTEIGPVNQPGIVGRQGLSFSAKILATADLSHVVWETQPIASKQQWPFALGEYQVVEYTGAHNSEPMLVGVENAGPPPWKAGATHVNEGAELIGGGCPTSLGNGGNDFWSALSADGRTVYFTACPSKDQGGLYARIDGETSEAHTVKISADGNFVGASADGSKAFFLTGIECSEKAGPDCGLYESQCAAHCEGSGVEERNEQRTLIDVSAGSPTPEVQGVVAISADGSHVYFVANGVLTGVANSAGDKAALGHCRPPRIGTCNLYVYERDARYPEGHIAFITSVPGSDADNWKEGVYANVTPEGRFLVFESHGDLTADDTRTDGVQQIFRYDADQSGAEEAAHVPALQRISIGNDGYNDNGNQGVPGEEENHGPNIDSGGPTIVPAAYGESYDAGSARGDPTMSNDGSRVFFQSPIGLTPRALNDVMAGYDEEEVPSGSGKFIANTGRPAYAENVYEWEQEGVGSCPAGRGSGCVFLVSDGSDVSEARSACSSGGAGSCLLGTDATGANVFFMTSDQLVPKDTDTQVDVYDARICEPEEGNPCVVEPPPPLPPCDGENCHGIPAATPSLLAPGTASFNGEGNVTQSPPPPAVVKTKADTCKRGYVKKKVKKKELCIKAKSKKKTRAKKASRDRRVK
jgi:NHL repeat/WD40-like Beta Propeller Repeat